MAKTKEELTTLQKEYETLNSKLKELTEEELNLVVGGGQHYRNEVSALSPCHFNPSRFSGDGDQVCGRCSHLFESGVTIHCTLMDW